jgi:hypothetical protein
VKATRKAGGPRKAIISTIIFAISLSIAMLLFASAVIAGVRWTANGVAISDASGSLPQVVPDDVGGSIIAWYDAGTIMAQRLSPSGSAMWTAGGVQVCNDAGLSTTFYLPDGQVGSDVETFTLVQNPNATPVNITVTYLLPTGAPVSFSDTVAANTRKTFNMKDKGVSGQAGIVVSSTTAGKKIMVERAMYFFNRGAGTDTIGGYSD